MSAGLSYAVGPADQPVPAGTIADWLDRAVELYGDRPALILPSQGVRWSWAELGERVDALARGLDGLGLAPGDRLGICAPNCAEWVLTQLATARLGIILVSINPAYRTHELGHALRLSGVRALVTAGRFNIQFTSGTTGAPKGATLSHRNLLHNAVSAAAGMRLGPDDSLCIPVPLYHCFGMVLGVLVCLTSGAAMVFPGQAFDPVVVLKTVAEERCTALHGVPTMFLSMLDHEDFADFDLSSLRTGIAAGAPCPPAMMRRMIEAMNLVDITIGYGMTETSPLSTQTRPGADLETRTDTVGQMLPHYEGRVIDGEGNVLPLGQPGEYCSRGPGVMLGYWNQPEATAAAIRDGWMHSGDLATIDDQGRVRIVGRIKDMIIRGGENIYPAEVEAFLLGHPDIADAAVFGIADARLGERVCAWVRVHRPLAPEAIVEWCRGQIAHHKIPALVRIVDEFPMTVTGKVQKFAMRDAEAAD